MVRDRGTSEDTARRIALTCSACGLAQFWEHAAPGVLTAADTSKYPPGVVAVGGPVDWYFHLPLWLQTPCCGEILWADPIARALFAAEAGDTTESLGLLANDIGIDHTVIDACLDLTVQSEGSEQPF